MIELAWEVTEVEPYRTSARVTSRELEANLGHLEDLLEAASPDARLAAAPQDVHQ
jgi:hypothetical protein